MSMLGAYQGIFRAAFGSHAKSLMGMFMTGNVAAPDFNQLYAKVINDTKSGIEFKDLNNLQTVLKDLDPTLFSKFKREATKLGAPARKAVNNEFKQFRVGPLGPAKRRKGERTVTRLFDRMDTFGRLSWAESRSKRNIVDVNYKGKITSKNLNNPAVRAGDKTLSLIRVRVRGAAYVVADMAGRSGKVTQPTGAESRPYDIHLFGRGTVRRTHKINAENVSNWLEKLNAKSSQKRASRFAWPAIIAHGPEYRKNFSGILSQYIAETNRKLNA